MNNNVKDLNPEIIRYVRDAKRRNNYQLSIGYKFPIEWFRISKPKKQSIKNRGATIVLDTFVNGERRYLTSLIRLSKRSEYYLGDLNGKTLVVWIGPDLKRITFAYFGSHRARGGRERLKLIVRYFRSLTT